MKSNSQFQIFWHEEARSGCDVTAVNEKKEGKKQTEQWSFNKAAWSRSAESGLTCIVLPNKGVRGMEITTNGFQLPLRFDHISVIRRPPVQKTSANPVRQSGVSVKCCPCPLHSLGKRPPFFLTFAPANVIKPAQKK